MGRFITIAGALLGLSGVMAGALFDHLLASYSSHGVETAIRYHQLYAILITVLGVTMSRTGKVEANKYIGLACLILISGTLIFCASLYATSLSGIPQIAYGVPAGGITLMFGWLVLGWAGFAHL